MSLRSIYDTLARHLKDVFRTSSKTFWRLLRTFLQDVLKTSWRCTTKANTFGLIRTSLRHLEDVFWRLIGKQIYLSCSRLLEDALKTFSEDEDGRHLLNVFKMSSTRGMFAGIWKIDLCLFEYWTSLLVTLSSLTILSTIYNVLKVISHYKQELLGFRRK